MMRKSRLRWQFPSLHQHSQSNAVMAAMRRSTTLLPGKTNMRTAILAIFIPILVSQTNARLAGSVTMISPSPNAPFEAGTCITLQAASTNNVPAVQIFDGAIRIGEAFAPNYRLTWTTPSRGPHHLRVTSEGGDDQTSAGIDISVNDPTTPVDLSKDVNRYNVSFDTLGVNARDSMPLGNGDVSLNVWTYPDGDVGLLIGKLDAYAENGKLTGSSGFFSLRKIGRVRLSFDPPVFKQAAVNHGFRQQLVLGEAAIYLRSPHGELKIWVDKNRSVIHAEWSGQQDVGIIAKDDSWRTSDVPKTHIADIVFPNQGDQVIWCYHDPRTSVGYRNRHEQGVVEGGLPGAELLPKYTTVTFGALMRGEPFKHVDDLTLRSGPAKRARLDINVLRYSKQNQATPEHWLPLIKSMADQQDKVNYDDAWHEHLRWWRDFWDRSQIVVTRGEKCEQVTAGYLHNRFLNAAQAGALTELWRIPFNGGTFNVDFLDVELGKPVNRAKTPEQKATVLRQNWTGVNPQDPDAAKFNPELCAKTTPDYRLWGVSDRSQNTRHVYWPMLMGGDYDIARPWYEWPAIASEDWEKQVKTFTGKADCISLAGISAWEGLGKTQFIKRGGQYLKRIVPEGIGQDTGARRWTIDICDEYLPYMLDYYELTQDNDFLQRALLPYSQKKFKFIDQWFPRDTAGKLILWPCDQSEVYVRYPADGLVPANPVSGVALLRTQLPRLLALKGKSGVTAEMIELWQKVLDEAPSYPIGTRRNGKPGLLPHEAGWDQEEQKTQGADRATLYAIWPFRAFMFPQSGTAPADYELAVNTLALGDRPSMHAWFYGDYCAAILGLARRVKQGVVTRAGGKDKNFRFPYFWYANPDYAPCPEFGGIMQSTLQYMLWNWKGDTIYLCPAWPKDWDCNFKFRGPQNTIVQGRISGGNVTIEHVIPESRRKNIVVCPLQ